MATTRAGRAAAKLGRGGGKPTLANRKAGGGLTRAQKLKASTRVGRAYGRLRAGRRAALRASGT